MDDDCPCFLSDPQNPGGIGNQKKKKNPFLGVDYLINWRSKYSPFYFIPLNLLFNCLKRQIFILPHWSILNFVL